VLSSCRCDDATDVHGSLGENGEIRVEYGQSFGGLGTVPLDFTIRQRASIFFRFPTRTPVGEAIEIAGRIRNFVSLAVGRAATVVSVTGWQDDFRPRGTAKEPIELYFAFARNPKPPDKPLHPGLIPFTLQEIAPRLGDVAQAWFDRYEIVRSAFDLYFGTLYSPLLFLDQKFIGYVQAIEAYDRHRRPDATQRPEKQHQERLAAILASAPNSRTRGWLKSKLKWSNELSLAERLTHVLSACPATSERILLGQPVPDFIQSLVDTRNYNTHYTKQLEDKALKSRGLLVATLQLRAILEMAFLRELGFTCDEITASLDRSRRFNEIEQIAAG
jgi:hypothetical protein